MLGHSGMTMVQPRAAREVGNDLGMAGGKLATRLSTCPPVCRLDGGMWHTASRKGCQRQTREAALDAGLDTSRAWERFGFRAKTDFRAGLRRTIDWYSAKK